MKKVQELLKQAQDILEKKKKESKGSLVDENINNNNNNNSENNSDNNSDNNSENNQSGGRKYKYLYRIRARTHKRR